MLLQRLKEYSERLDLPPTLYSESPVRYIIELDETGRLLGMTDTADPSSPRTRRGQRRLVPVVQRASGIRPLLLADKADYVLGHGGQDSKPERVQACHQAFLDLVDRCALETDEPTVSAVQLFLRSGPLGQLQIDENFDPGATITFRVGQGFPVELPAVQEFWALENDPGRTNAVVMQCVVCGHEKPVLERLQGKIKGVPGGQTSGTSIISANAEAFESYGLQASLISPTCADCGERFTKAANYLLSSEANCIRISGMAFVFWTREETGFDFFKLMTDPQADQVKAIIDSVRTGKHKPEIDDTPFYATSLSGSGGRTVVRDWLDTTVGEVQRHLGTWFQRQEVVDPSGAQGRPLGIYALAYATVRERKDLPTPTPRALLRAAMTGAPLSWNLLYQVVRRIKAQSERRGERLERKVTHSQAALIKLVLLSQPNRYKEDEMVGLDPDNPNPAYRCGRLLAVLEEAQTAAIRDINTTVADRFYGTASSAPASVFSRLIRGAQPHLAKLKRDNPGAHYALQNRLEEILAAFPGDRGFPRVLTLEEQGLFSLGYYHQRAHDRTERREAAERRRQGLPSTIVEDNTKQDSENSEEG